MLRRNFLKSIGIASVMPLINIKPVSNSKLYTWVDLKYIADNQMFIHGSNVFQLVIDTKTFKTLEVIIDNRKFKRVELIKDKILFREV